MFFCNFIGFYPEFSHLIYYIQSTSLKDYVDLVFLRSKYSWSSDTFKTLLLFKKIDSYFIVEAILSLH